jgi:hypothetical protein
LTISSSAKKRTGEERGELAQKKATAAYQSYIEVSKKAAAASQT